MGIGAMSSRLAAAALVAVLLLTGCTATGSDGSGDPSLQGQWELDSARDASGSFDLAGSHITLTIRTDETTSGRTACGTYSARVLGTLSDLWVTTAAKHPDRCTTTERTRLDKRYLAALGSVRQASVSGGLLELSAPGGARLHFQRSIDRPLTQAFGTQWRLVLIRSTVNDVGGDDAGSDGGDSVDAGGLEQPAYGVRMTVDPSGRVSGVTGCHSFDATWKRDAGEVLVTGFVFTQNISCYGPVASIESQFLSVLSAGFVLAPGGNALILDSSRAGLRMVFEGVPN